MTLTLIDIGLVSQNESLADFYATVFELERLESMPGGPGMIHRVQGPGVLIKVMVPRREPMDGRTQGKPFFATSGLRYLTVYVNDLDGVLSRAGELGAVVTMAAMDAGPGVRIAVMQDPDGNAIEMVENLN